MGFSLQLQPQTGVPKGTIAMWYGTVANIPSGWAFCNGAGGRPDLRNIFPAGANADNGTIPLTNVSPLWFPNAATGGQEYQNSVLVLQTADYVQTANVGASQAWDFTESAITDSFNVIPPFRAVLFIIKL